MLCFRNKYAQTEISTPFPHPSGDSARSPVMTEPIPVKDGAHPGQGWRTSPAGCETGCAEVGRSGFFLRFPYFFHPPFARSGKYR